MNVDSPSRAVSDEAVLRIVREVLIELHPGRKDMDPVTLDSALEEDLGLDSLARVELLMRLERAFGVRPPEQLLSFSHRQLAASAAARLCDQPDGPKAIGYGGARGAKFSEPSGQKPKAKCHQIINRKSKNKKSPTPVFVLPLPLTCGEKMGCQTKRLRAVPRFR